MKSWPHRVFEALDQAGGTLPVDVLLDQLDCGMYEVRSAIYSISQKPGMDILRLNSDGEELDTTGLNGHQIGQQTQALQLIQTNGHTPEWRPEYGKETGESKGVDVYNIKTFYTPCRLPLKKMQKCYHGPRCANGHKCPVARKIRERHKWNDQRAEARRKLELQGYKIPWTFKLKEEK